MTIQSKVENIPWLVILETLQEKFENTEPLGYLKIEEELKSFTVTLDSDPSSIGLGKLNEKIAAVDSYMSRTVTILTTAINNAHKFESLLGDVQALYDKHLRVQLKSEDVSSLSNQNLRQAAAEDKVSDIGKLKYAVEKMLNEAKTHTEVCREKLKSLDTTNKNISRQITVIQTQLEVGEIARKLNRRYDSDF